MGNKYHNLEKKSKAGENRRVGIRSRTSANCMNPVDHVAGGRTKGKHKGENYKGNYRLGKKTVTKKNSYKTRIIEKKRDK